jgi:hypothetical protein
VSLFFFVNTGKVRLKTIGNVNRNTDKTENMITKDGFAFIFKVPKNEYVRQLGAVPNSIPAMYVLKPIFFREVTVDTITENGNIRQA